MTFAEALDLALRCYQGGDLAGAFALCDQAIALAPEQPALWQLSGLAAYALGRFQDAADRFDRARRLEPLQSAHAVNYANALIKLGRDAEAVRALNDARRLSPDSPEVEIGLGTLARRAGLLEAAVAHADRALTLAPDSYQAPVNRGRALHELGRCAEAIQSYDRAIAIDPGSAPAHAQKALSLLLTGNFAAGWDEYEWRGEGRDLDGRARFAEPEWDGGPLGGQTLLVHAEQGFGDTIQFARFLPEVAKRGGRVITEVQPALKRLMSGIAPAVEIVARGEPLPRFDRQVRLLSLPRVLGTRIDTIPSPALFMVPETQAAADLLPDPRLTVGLSWAGSPAHENDRYRSIPPALLDHLGTLADIRFVSLQKEMGQSAGRLGFAHLDLGSALRDFADLAAVMQRLDLVVTVDSAPAHLMGSLGRPVWVLLPDPPDWRWLLGRDDSPWYPNARLFRQKIRDDWREVIDRVRVALERLRDKKGSFGGNPSD